MLGSVPSYYLRYFYAHDEVVEELRAKPSRAAEVAAIERKAARAVRRPDGGQKPAVLEQRGGAYYSEAAVALVAALLGNRAGVAPTWSTSATTARCRSSPTTP